MAGNNSIQLLRGNYLSMSSSSATLLPGQPVYQTDKNYLMIGGEGGTDKVNKNPIYARELVGYDSDSDGAITGISLTRAYEIKGESNGTGQKLLINSGYGVNIDGKNGWVNINGTGVNINSGSLAGIRLCSGTSVFLSSGTGSLNISSGRACIYAGNFYLSPQSATTQGNVIEITGNGVTADIDIGQYNASTSIGYSAVNVRGCMVHIISSGTCGITMCSSQGVVINGYSVTANANGARLALTNAGGINAIALDANQITINSPVYTQTGIRYTALNVNTNGMYVAGGKVSITSSTDISIKANPIYPVDVYANMLRVFSASGGYIGLMDTRIERNWSATTYSYQLPMSNGSIALTMRNTANATMNFKDSTFYTRVGCSDAITQVGSSGTYRYLHHIHLNGGSIGDIYWDVFSSYTGLITNFALMNSLGTAAEGVASGWMNGYPIYYASIVNSNYISFLCGRYE